MRKKFKINKDFIPCPVDDEDELYPNGIFEFNITKIHSYIERNPSSFSVEYVSIDDFPSFASNLHEDYVSKANVSRPVIIAEISPGRYNLIDGHHRAEKARRMGLATLPAYKLEAEQYMPFLTSRRAYETYIEYWNEKLQFLNGRR